MSKFIKLIKAFFPKAIYGRIYSLRKGIIFYLSASFTDLIALTIISKIFSIITISNVRDTLPFYSLVFVLTIFLRTFMVYTFRRYGYLEIIYNKSQIESQIVQKFVSNRIYLDNDEDESINRFKENLINSTLTAAINFDLPIISLIAELFFAIGAIFFIINTLGIKVFLINFPLLIIILILTKYLSKKIYKLGTNVLKKTEERLNTIDNISEISIEISAQKSIEPLINSFSDLNNSFNNILAKQSYTQNAMQILIESISFLLIFITLISIIANLTNVSLSNSASVLAILSRMVPSITRSFASYSQIQYGIPAIKRLEKLNLNNN